MSESSRFRRKYSWIARNTCWGNYAQITSPKLLTQQTAAKGKKYFLAKRWMTGSDAFCVVVAVSLNIHKFSACDGREMGQQRPTKRKENVIYGFTEMFTLIRSVISLAFVKCFTQVFPRKRELENIFCYLLLLFVDFEDFPAQTICVFWVLRSVNLWRRNFKEFWVKTIINLSKTYERVIVEKFWKLQDPRKSWKTKKYVQTLLRNTLTIHRTIPRKVTKNVWEILPKNLQTAQNFATTSQANFWHVTNFY